MTEQRWKISCRYMKMQASSEGRGLADTEKGPGLEERMTRVQRRGRETETIKIE